MQKLAWKLDLPLFTHDYRKCMFVDIIAGYINPPNHVHYHV